MTSEMPIMTDDIPTTADDFKDRKVGLIVFGSLELLLGTFCILMMLLMAFSLFLTSSMGKEVAANISLKTMVPGLAMYIALAIWFIWMGVGSILARRWARALVLVTSWIWLIAGTFGLIGMLFVMKGMLNMPQTGGAMSGGFLTVFKFVMIGFSTLLYVIIPGSLVIFYGSRHVKATCELHDPRIRWTDKCPLPVLSLSIISILGAVSTLQMGFYGWAMPVFGHIVSGAAGAGTALLMILVLGYVAWASYRLNIKAWWCAVLFGLVSGSSYIITFTRVDLIEFYQKLKMPAQQLAAVEQITKSISPWIPMLTGLGLIIYLGYLLWVRKYFKKINETAI